MSSSYYNCLTQIGFDSEYTPIFFDIGCNINKIPSHCGTLDDFTELVLELYPNSKCYGFDPLHWQAYEEKWNEDSRVTVVKKAVSDSNDNKTLYIPGANEPIKAHAISSFYNSLYYLVQLAIRLRAAMTQMNIYEIIVRFKNLVLEFILMDC